MIHDTILQLVNDYGYLFFFLAFCLGPFGVPVPNEVTILTGAILADSGYLNARLVYVFIVSGLLVAVTAGYFAGNLLRRRMSGRFESNRYLRKADQLFAKYGELAMGLGYLLPVVRYAVPVFAGISGVPFRKFALISYSGALIWTSVYFTVGMGFGNHVFTWLTNLDLKTAGALLLIAAFCGWFLKWAKPKNACPGIDA